MAATNILARRLAFMPSSTTKRQLSRILQVSFHEGDHVKIRENDRQLQGIIKETRGSGWFSVEIGDNPTDISLRKFRASQLTLISNGIKSSGNGVVDKITINTNLALENHEDVIPIPPPPTIDDLDSALRTLSIDPVNCLEDNSYLSQVAHHLSFSNKWVLFTDLHCAPSTLDTCIEVLDFVHQRAVDLDAGILFLGDWWHHRGTLRVDTLNAVLDSLSTWTQPLIMIPGNHDQVTLNGYNHALKPLQNAFRTRNSYAGPLIFSRPTIFGKALFVPHIRDNAVMESVLGSIYGQTAEAVFCHADITGGKMNDQIISQGGVAPRFFPPRKPVYSGHFHKPHIINTSTGQSIEYIGSPYETTLSEAQQEKHLLVLDSSLGWQCIERHPIELGRKHFRGESLNDLIHFQSKVRSGDRVVLSITTQNLLDLRRTEQIENNNTILDEVSVLDSMVSKLRQEGATVEIREIKALDEDKIRTGKNTDSGQQLDDLNSEEILISYLTEEVRNGSLPNATAKEILKAGTEIINKMEISNELPLENPQIEIKFTSMALEGFGPFKNPVFYPLLERGLVLLRGNNKDCGSDSNGTGKSSLAMAALWALTGSVDPRPVSDGRVADVVTDGCNATKVILDGFINEKAFRIMRTKTAKKSNLVFFLDEEDRTTQSTKETQQVIDETLGIDLDILGRTVFHGQHNLHGLLEATDGKLKDELSHIVPLEIWQSVAKIARAEARKCSKNEAELIGMIKLREEDLVTLEERQDLSLEKLEKRRAIFLEKENAAKAASNFESHANQSSVIDIQSKLDHLGKDLNTINFQLEQQRKDQRKEEEVYRRNFEEQVQQVEDAKLVVNDAIREVDKSTFRIEMANVSCINLEKKWKADLFSGKEIKLNFERCPTCLQPILDGVGRSHDELQNIVQEEIRALSAEKENAYEAKNEATRQHNEANLLLQKVESRLKEVSSDLKDVTSKWNEKIAETKKAISGIHARQKQCSSQLAEAVANVQTFTTAQAIKLSLESEKELLNSAEEQHEKFRHDLKKAEEKILEMKSKAHAERSRSSILSQLSDVTGAKGVQTFILRHTVEALQIASDKYLDHLSDGSLKLSLALDTGDKILRQPSVLLPSGDFAERSLSCLSGGQWRRCSLALSFGFLDLVSRRGRLRSSLLVLDEPLTHLDRSGRNRVGSILRKLLKGDTLLGLNGGTGICANTIILILQDLAAEELEEAFDCTDEVVKENGFSSVLIDEYDQTAQRVL